MTSQTTPETDEERILRHGKHVFETAYKLGWKDDGEGPLEFLMRKSYETGYEDNADGGRKHGN